MVGADVEENPHGTQVSPFFFLLPRMRFIILLRSSFFVLQRYRSKDQIYQSPTQHSSSAWLTQIGSPSVQSTRSSLRSSSLLQSSKHLFKSVLPLFFFRSFLFCSSSKSSLRDLILLFRTQVYKTRDLYGIILPTHQVGIESLNLEF